MSLSEAEEQEIRMAGEINFLRQRVRALEPYEQMHESIQQRKWNLEKNAAGWYVSERPGVFYEGEPTPRIYRATPLAAVLAAEGWMIKQEAEHGK